MIDLEKGKSLFTKYVENYDMKNEKINLKYHHTLRVMDFCRKIAESLNLKKDDVEIAMLTGLLHDIGRFEQVKIYNTFVDRDSIDHADFGVELLQKDNYIDEYVSDKDVQKIVLTAIKNHNKLKIEDGLDERMMLFAKIIRDADKLDIFDIFINQELRIKHTDSHISDKIYNDLINRRTCHDKDMETDMDRMLRQVGMFFDINFSYSIEYIKSNKLADRLINNIIEKNEHENRRLNDIRNELDDYFASIN